MNVTWKEPRFKDNVKIDRIDSYSKNGIMRNPTSFIVNYRAVDTSGNAASCKFNIYFESKCFDQQVIVNLYQYINQ